jgi:poly(3-hydroxyalkanoate) synthetase
MSKFTVKSVSSGKKLGAFRSASAAYHAAEQFFQSNLDESIDDVKSALNTCNIQYVKSCFGGDLMLVIEKA